MAGFENVGPYFAGGNGNCIFQQDNAPIHTAAATRAFLQARAVTVLDWPGNSPDLNPIENVWAYVQRSLPRTLPRNSEELWERIKNAWYQVPLELLQTLINYMPDRVAEVIRNHGGHTHY